MYEFLEKALTFENIRVHNRSYRRALLSALLESKRSIRVCTYVASFNFKKPGHPVNDIIEAILLKNRKPFEVYFLLDGEKRGAANRRPALLFEGFLKNQNVKCAVQMGRPTLHLKFFLIDEERAFIGSHNLTGSSLKNPLEATVEIYSPALGLDLAARFDQLFQVVKHG
jgi:phosphatidylserine/phosphatidylglycerophosphate/cardiolipin synthase-like enzyme